MDKIVFSITKINKGGNTKYSGCGYIVGQDLLIPAMSDKQKAYIRVFEDAVKYCHPAKADSNEFKGYYSEYITRDLVDSNDKHTTREICIDYLIWFKKLS